MGVGNARTPRESGARGMLGARGRAQTCKYSIVKTSKYCPTGDRRMRLAEGTKVLKGSRQKGQKEKILHCQKSSCVSHH
jgi:hypothetical protein